MSNGTGEPAEGEIRRRAGNVEVYDATGRAWRVLGPIPPRLPAPQVLGERKFTIRDPEAPANAKQIGFLMSLAEQHDIGMAVQDFKDMVASLSEGGALTMGWVSQHIDEFKALPHRELSVDPGYYTLGEGEDKEFYVVVRTRDNLRTYAKRMERTGRSWEWVYVKGAVSKLRGLTPLTLDEAAEWGRLHGRCLICHRELGDPESVKRGIGPVCAKKVKH